MKLFWEIVKTFLNGLIDRCAVAGEHGAMSVRWCINLHFNSKLRPVSNVHLGKLHNAPRRQRFQRGGKSIDTPNCRWNCSRAVSGREVYRWDDFGQHSLRKHAEHHAIKTRALDSYFQNSNHYFHFCYGGIPHLLNCEWKWLVICRGYNRFMETPQEYAYDILKSLKPSVEDGKIQINLIWILDTKRKWWKSRDCTIHLWIELRVCKG